MFQTPYAVPLPHYPYDYRTPPASPAGGPYYSTRHYSYNPSTPPPKGHARRATQDFQFTYSTPRTAKFHSAYDYNSPGFQYSAQNTPQSKPDYVNIYSRAEPAAETKPRPRRASHATKPASNPQPRPRASNTAKPSPQKASEEDARRAGIPAGYSYKNWDPSEEPILLLGSVFDANSLGKWIYDWTVFFYGPAAPMSEVAGELWVLLIQLAGKVKRAEETMSSIRQQKNRDLVDDFLESGERLWQRFNKLLKICENYMWKAAKRENSSAKNVTMGTNAGCEFVDSIFGRDRELDRTEKLMTGMRLWSMRFDANCEEILRSPSA
ncbi:vegetative cell wall protein gp1 [Polychaeton citri CBS 116435]|uniref:Vegetative cell wall protein gp1 n=1 Tax=Polychaeton citri CBS 116435 TaxID=1314669 RepID=A0A9P4Q6P1_9PEZI|nr:vegetative cell wall protein gp1 [Polychaeton citri CBS 116435]